MSDIVNRLRANRECLAPCLMDDAADEIVRLEQVVLALTAERDEARRCICRIELACRTVTIDEYFRKQLHGLGELISVEPEEVARERGWDCFEEDGK